MCLTLKKNKKKKEKKKRKERKLNWSPKGHFGNFRVRTEKGIMVFQPRSSRVGRSISKRETH
jgi:hypothetical protein